MIGSKYISTTIVAGFVVTHTCMEPQRMRNPDAQVVQNFTLKTSKDDLKMIERLVSSQSRLASIYVYAAVNGDVYFFTARTVINYRFLIWQSLL